MRWLVALILMLAPAIASAQTAAVVKVDGMVDDYMASVLEKRYAEAADAGADTVILQLNTYGGLVTSAIDISRMIGGSELRTVVLVDERAISAGAMIALSADAIYMEDGSLLGDSGVITMGGEMGEVERAKGESLVLEAFADSAERNGYDPLLARALVVPSITVYAVEGEDGLIFVEELAEGQESAEGIRSPLDGPGTILTVRASLAERIGMSRGTVADVAEVAEAEGLEVIATFEPTAGDRLVALLAGYAARGILTTVFFLSVFAAFRMPGTGFPEAIALASGGLLVAVPLMTGVGEWWEVLLVVLGLVLIAVEVFVLPGFGVPGIAGAVSLLGGLTLMFLPPLTLPGGGGGLGAISVDMDQLGRALATTVGGGLLAMMLWLWLGRMLPHLPIANRIVLPEGSVGGTDPEPAGTAPWPPVGLIGTATSDLYPGGQASFEDAAGTHLLDVVCDRGFVDAGQGVVVRSVTGNRIVVRPVPGGDAS